MRKEDLCPGGKTDIHESTKADKNGDYLPLKPKRLKCPKCGRKVMTTISYCEDHFNTHEPTDCGIHIIPPHKPKGWWKKKRRKSGKENSLQRRRL